MLASSSTVLIVGLWAVQSDAAADDYALSGKDLAVIVNEADPLSVDVAEYYRRKRGIPAENMIRVTLDASEATMQAKAFNALRAEVMQRTPSHVQGYALTWVRPYRVECMSVTTAFAAGFDPSFCSKQCTPTRYSPYFNSDSQRPFDDFGWRPTMSIAALDFKRAKQLIDRGVDAGKGAARGKAYLVETDDVLRNVRASRYADAKRMVEHDIDVELVHAPALEGRPDVMFYFIGAANVEKIDSNRFLPGALADHLTSWAGDLTGDRQMSALRWLEAGATGSYGTVVEPCNLPGKFPSVGLVMQRYLAGETLLEAYWKSVAMPGQGLFIGDPLARPYRARAHAARMAQW